MIDKNEIEIKSKELGVHTSDVQRDYIFGWLLSGIYNTRSDLQNTLILKGGNCFRKAYFENTRYSNDLDFSTQREIDPADLRNQVNAVCEYVGNKTGVSFAVDKNNVMLKRGADKDTRIYEARVYFKGFYGEENYNIKVKLDVQEYDKIFLPTQTRNIIHPYSDSAECQGQVICIKLEELLASKLKALLQRRHSPDLYDFIYSVFFQNVLTINRLEVVSTFLKKTIYQPNPTVARNLLLELPFQAIKGFWNQYLVCPKQSLINFDDAEARFKSIISELFGLMQPALVMGGTNGLAYFSANHRNLVMESGRSQTLLRLVYDGFQRLVEPYALSYKIRKDGVGQEYLYAWDRTGGSSGVIGIKSFTQDKIQSVEKTDEKFEPRFPIELSKAGEFGSKTYFGSPFPSGSRAPRISNRIRGSSFGGITYKIECPFCGKKFTRSSYDTKLNKHKDEYGNQCYGRSGILI